MRITEVSRESYLLSEFEFGPLRGRRYVVFDLEATGLDPEADCITQIGAVAVYDGGPRDEEAFSCLVRPRRPIPPEIEELTGITNERVASAPDLGSVWSSFMSFCGQSALVTQCGYEFDYPLLDCECSRVRLPLVGQLRLDTKAIFAVRNPERHETFSTNFLSDHYGIDRSAFKRHDALGDARLISRFFFAQLRESCLRGEDTWTANTPVRIKKFVLPAL